MNRARAIQLSANGVLVVLWAGTTYAVMTKVFEWKLPFGFESEPVAVVLGTISTVVTTLVSYFGIEIRAKENEIEEEKYSMPRALAYGYVNNFVAPLMKRLLQQAGPHADEVRLHVFIPDELADLEPVAVEGTLAKMRAKNYSTKVINLELEQGRPRDVLTVMKGADGRAVYFDFPNTLLTLNPVVDFKAHSEIQATREKMKRELGAKFIKRFKEFVEQELNDKRLTDYVELTDKSLDFLS